MSLTDDSPTTSNVAEYTVSEISGALKRTVENAFGHVRLRGEISGYRGPHSSGHAYFSLKDDRARIDAVVWRTSFAKLAFKPQEGLEIIATGRLTTYAGSSKYQIVIETIEPAGAGALMALLDERRRKLEAEGLFAAERKRPLPYLPKVIGIITSPTGAVIRDICHRIADRFPVHLLVWPVRVQGETCGDEVARAIEGFGTLDADGTIPRPDLLIVARGGGSLEDLWGFNDEAVVRAAAASPIPLISAVGHETDWTLIDHAADRRAPTPTGAAEIAVPVRADLVAAVAALHARHGAAATRRLDQERRHVAATARALPPADMLLAIPRRRLDEAQTGLGRSLRVAIVEKRRSFVTVHARLAPDRLESLVRDKWANLRHHDAAARHAIGSSLGFRRREFERVAGQLQPHRLGARSEAGRLRLETLARRLNGAEAGLAGARRQRFAAAVRMVDSLNPMSVLERGYTIVEDDEGVPVTDPEKLVRGSRFDVIFAGKVRRHAVVDGDDAQPASPSRASGARPKRPTGADVKEPSHGAAKPKSKNGEKRAVEERLANDQGKLF